MGWCIDVGVDELYLHEGFLMDMHNVAVLPTTGGSEAGRAPLVYTAACSCGWRGTERHQVSADAPIDAELEANVAASLAAEAAERSARDEWCKHMAGLRAIIELREIASKLRVAEAEVAELRNALDAAAAAVRELGHDETTIIRTVRQGKGPRWPDLSFLDREG